VPCGDCEFAIDLPVALLIALASPSSICSIVGLTCVPSGGVGASGVGRWSPVCPKNFLNLGLTCFSKNLLAPFLINLPTGSCKIDVPSGSVISDNFWLKSSIGASKAFWYRMLYPYKYLKIKIIYHYNNIWDIKRSKFIK
jgi:hypothetical protein